VATLVVFIATLVVFAVEEEKTIHVFPTAVKSENWMKENNALEQSLGDQAVLEDFDRDNSAFVIFIEHEKPDEVKEEVSEEEGGTEGVTPNDAAEETEQDGVTEEVNNEAGESTPAEEVIEEEEVEEQETIEEEESTIAPMEDLTMHEYLFDLGRGFVGKQAHAQEVVEDTEEVEQVPEEVEEPQMNSEEEAVVAEPVTEEIVEEVSEVEDIQTDETSSGVEETVSEPEEGIADEIMDEEVVEDDTENSDQVEEVQEEQEIKDVVSDEEVITDTSVEEGVDEDVRVCKVLGTECYTLEFDGFDIGSVLSEETVTGYTLNASLAAHSDIDRFTDDKVLVRYFYKGKWHLAGEIAIRDTISNFENGGHFRFALPDLSGWDALHTFKVEFEFVRQSDVRTDFYLDSVWVETTYRTDGNEGPVFPDNVLEELEHLEQARRGDLLRVDDDTVITLPYATTDGDDLVIRSSEVALESPGTGEMYFSVTNIGDSKKDFSLSFYMPDEESEPQMLRQWMYNIPEEEEVIEYGSLAQYCEGTWVPDEDEPERYLCAETGVDLYCSELNSDMTNCIENNVEVGRHTETAYREGWHEYLLDQEVKESSNEEEVGENGETATDAMSAQVAATEDEKEKESFIDRVRRWFSFTKQPERDAAVTYTSKNTFTVAPDQTLFFSSRIEYPQISEGGFAVVATARNEAPALDISWKSDWRYRLPVEFDRDMVGDRLDLKLTVDDVPHMFSHVGDWSQLFIREADSHSAEWLPFTHTVVSDSRVELSVDLSTLSSGAHELEVYYGDDEVMKEERKLRGSKLFINPEALSLGRDAEGAADDLTELGYRVGTVQEVVLDDEPNHRVLVGEEEDGSFPEDGKLVFAYRSNRAESREGVFADVPDTNDFSIARATLIHAGKGEVPDTSVIKTVGNEWVLNTGMSKRTFTPGKYILEVEVVEGDTRYVDTQEFYWGVLTWNTTKSVYEVGETATMHMGVLADSGSTVCDATLELTLRTPSGEEVTVPVSASGVCVGNTVVGVPDYSAAYTLGEVGTYDVLLKSIGKDGTVLHQIEDSIVVETNTPYIIERTGPTRIYPVADYIMMLAVTTDNTYVGTVREVVPASFRVYDYGDARIYTEGNETFIEWDVALIGGERAELSYSFDAPDISPYVYRLGPATLGDVFTELREWQIASDATGNMLILWDDGATVPTGWTCVSCTSGDPFYQRFIMGSSTYNTTGGATTHNHSATGSVYTSGAGATESLGSGVIEVVGHTHTYTPTISSENNLPLYRQLRVLEYNSAGEPTELPAGAIVYFDATVPSGWTQYAAQDGYYVYGENTPGTTGGSNTHSHTISGSTDTSVGDSVGSRGGGTQASAATDAHTHTVSGGTLTDSNEPPYVEMILGKLDATTTLPNGMIGMWTDEVPTGWLTISSSTETLENKFIKPAATYGSEGGSAAHAHSDVTGLTSSLVGGAASRAGSSGVEPHTHTVDVTSFSTESSLPPYATAIFGKRFSDDPIYTQNYYRFYVNEDAEPPTDPWPAGVTDLAENARITTSDYTSKGDVVRMRMSVSVTNATSTADTDAFKLQYAAGSTCSDSGLVWYDVAPIGSTTAPWRGYDNSSLTDGTEVSSTTLSVSDVFETYEEENPSASTTNDIEIDQEGEWDWVVQHNNASAGTDYCFRMVQSDGRVFSGYNNYPQLITDEAPVAATLLTPFDNEKASSTAPVFTFYTTDPEGDAIHYQIQVDDDYLFGSPVIDANSITSTSDFGNVDTPADKAPFNSGDTMKYDGASGLSNNTTYWWRVRGRDTEGSDQWGDWSDARSFTTDTSVTISTWFQTTDEQFDTDTLTGTESSGGSDQVVLTTGSTTGSVVSTAIDFDWGTDGNAWGYLYFTDTEISSDLKYSIEYYDTDSEEWGLIPDTDLSGNSTGFDTSPVTLLSLDTSTYNQIRLVADLTNSGASPILHDWTVEWGTRVQQPTLMKLFDNEKTGTTTPSFEFTTTDPQDDDLVYEINWSTDYTFITGITSRVSDTDTGFQNITNGVDTSPFTSGDDIRFTVQGSDALTNGSTYWWRVRAKDPSGGDTWSDWSEKWSFTVDTSVVASTWFQTTNEQFDTDGLFGITTLGGNAEVATSVTDVLVAYGQAGSNAPKYRFWDGSSWGNEYSALDVGAVPYWVVTHAHPSAEMYALATIGLDADVNVQLYEDGSWGSLQEMTTTISNTNARGVDIAFEQSSGDLMVAYCDGDADPSYRVYNESTGWGTVGAINLSSTNNCEWIQLAADPVSDEIIVVSLDSTGSQYEAQVWNGTAWGNATIMGSMLTSGHEGIAVEYEESGDQAIVAVSDGNGNRIRYNTWNGTTWGTVSTEALGDNYEWGTFARDDGTDAMTLCYVDFDTDIGALFWTGSAWVAYTERETVGSTNSARPVACQYETEGVRDGYLMMSYSDDTNARYQAYNGATWSTEASISTITDSAPVQSVRSDDGLILSMFFDGTNGRYDFSYWNGSSWSTAETLESSPSVTGAPYKEPFMMAPRNSAVEGTMYSSAINYSDGTGPQWDLVSWNDSEPGASTLIYQVQYYDDSTSNWLLVPDSALLGNSVGTSTSPIDISNLSTVTYSQIRIKASFTCDSGSCPSLYDWTVTWSEGFTVSGIAREYDQTTAVTAGSIAIAVNGSLQVGKTGTVSGGVWTISNVTAFEDDVITVWIDGAAEANEAVGVTRYDGLGPITGMTLYERHLAIGSDDHPTISNTDLAYFDYSVSGDEDILHDVDINNDLYVCATGQATCGNEQLWVQDGSVFEPATSTSEFVYTHDVDIEGTIEGDSNTFEVSGSWTNEGIFNADGSSVVFDATSTSESIDSSSATTSSFYDVTFGQGASTATWSLSSPLDVNGSLTLASGTFAPGAGYTISVAEDLTVESAGVFTKNTGTTTLDGTLQSYWTDSSATLQDMGTVVVDGTSKTVSLGSDVRATTVVIGADDILALGGNTLELTGSFDNNGSLVPQLGEVLFIGTTVGNTVDGGASSFYDLSFNGSGGNWSFPSGRVSVSNDVSIVDGIVTMPNGTSTIGGSLTVTGGSFVHNNGVVYFTSNTTETITANSSLFYDMKFNGNGNWTITDTNATSSNDVSLLSGTLHAPTGTFAIGGSLIATGGIYNHSSGTLRLYGSGVEVLRVNNSNLNDVLIDGTGSYTMTDTNLSILGDLDMYTAGVTFPTGVLTLSGSLNNVSGSFTHNSGSVLFNATSTGHSVTVNGSPFYNVTFDAAAGGWTVTNSATSANNWSLLAASSFTAPNGGTVEVQGDFLNEVGGVETNWTGSTLYLNSGATSTINTKVLGADSYATLQVGANTGVKMWNSDASSYLIDSSGYLYSQDHAGSDGDLYVWGSYVRDSGTEYWSYATDFDGEDITGSERAVSVLFADGAYATVTEATLEILGTAAATTTIDRQGSGSYSVVLSDGAVNAQYYSFANLNSNGFTLTGSSSITKLGYGAYTLGVNGGSLITVSSTTLDANPARQWSGMNFATTTAISGYNVSLIGTPVSYWTFKDHTGNLSGEEYDNDPGGDPGNLRWDDSAFSITISGTVYSDVASGVPSFCDGSTDTVFLKVDGGGSWSTSCDAGTGAYSISGVDFSGDATLTLYLKSAGTTGAVVTKTPNGDIADMDIYEHYTIVRHEDVSPLAIADMDTFDSGDDSDVPFTVAVGTPNTLTVASDSGLYIWNGKEFAPDGNITLLGGGAGASYDGTLRFGTSSVLTAQGIETYTVGGSWIAVQPSTFIKAESTVVFSATTGGKILAPASTFNNVTFNGTGGVWSIASSTTVRGEIDLSAGTVTGSADLTVFLGPVTGAGVFDMTGGTVTILSGSDFGGTVDWTFNNLIFSTTTATTTTKVGAGNVVIDGTLTIGTNNTLEAGNVEWFFGGSGDVLIIDGVFDPQTSTTTYNGSSDLTVAATDYHMLNFAPTSGAPTYTIEAGNFSVDENMFVGSGSTVTVTADTNDPLITVLGDVTIAGNGTYIAAGSNDLFIGGSYDNNGTFTANAGGVIFNSTDTGETIAAGSSPLHHVYFTSDTGGWTLTENLTASGNFVLASSSDWTLASGSTLQVQGVFNNHVGGSATTWTGSTLTLNSGTSYSINGSGHTGDSYSTLNIGANTDVKMWYSSSTSYSVNASGSLYSQDHSGVDGDLYIFGDFVQSSGNQYWSYATDFDGSDLSGGTERKVDVYVANGSDVTLSGGTLELLGTSTATTTITNQGSGIYGFAVTGGTIDAEYYALRNLDATGLNISGSPTITSLSYGDYELAVNGGSLITVAGSAITANQLRIMYNNRFATSSGALSGTNVTATGVTGSSWRFTSHYGGLDGEGYDTDPGGDPGYVIWDDSAAQITISGNVLGTDEATVSSACDGSSQVVRFLINGASPQTTSCNAGTGYYAFTGIVYNVGDVFTVYLDTNGGAKASNVTVDPITNINDMHLYENRAIVRHESGTPVTITDLAVYDSDQDSDIPYDADAGSFTVTTGGKLIVWSGKSFAPGGDVTVASLGNGTSYDGDIELKDTASFIAAGTENHTIGGSFISGSGASLTAANSTFNFTSTSTGETIDTNTSAFANITFNGSGADWTFLEANATTTGDVTITNGTVTLATSSLAVGGSFVNTDTFIGTTTVFNFTSATAESVTFGGYDTGSLNFTGTGSWIMTDTDATTTGSVYIGNGLVILPSGTLAVRTSFENDGADMYHTGTLNLYGSEAAQTLAFGSSTAGSVLISGGGSWIFGNTQATTTGSVTIENGGLTAPSEALGIGGSLVSSGIFNANAGLLNFFATTTGHTVAVNGAVLGTVYFDGVGGGWTVAGSATSTSDWRLLHGSSFEMASSTILEVGGEFENIIGGSATNWTDSTLYLNASGTTFAINGKTDNGDSYANLIIGENTEVSMWNSSGATTTVDSTSYLYSQDHAANDGDLYIYGTYILTSGNEYWSYATDFDGTSLGGSSRAVDVRIASSSSVTVTGGTLEMLGVSGGTTTVDVIGGTGGYGFAIAGGTFNAEHYSFAGMDTEGVQFSGNPSITTLNDGTYTLDVDGGTMITVSSSTINNNPSRTFDGLSFSTGAGVSSGYNVTLSGTTNNIWQFTNHTGNYDGEDYDNDGVDACGQIRWSDSACLEVSQTHYRFRNDDGGEGAPSGEWFNASWDKRRLIKVFNTSGPAVTNYAFKVAIPYDGDMQADFDDVRFTDSSGTTELSYWFEDVQLSATATAWVKIPSLEANSVNEIYMYYGNALVASGENGADTFSFFDDFEDNDISEYSGSAQDLSYFATNASYNYEGSYGLAASGGNTDKQTNGGIYQTSTTFSQGSTVRFFQKITAGTDDEPCTLFGVQGSGQNYAVCLDQYPSDTIVISRDVTSNSDDGSATELASTGVTWSSGWYEVEINWLTDDSIDVTVYDSTGSVFATVSTTDSTYTSGGMGFAFWYQSEGWDFYTVRPYVASDPSYTIGASEQPEGGATWKVAQDTPLTGQAPNENFRVRFTVENTGTQITGQTWRLQYAPKSTYGACEGVPSVNYNDVPSAVSCGLSPVCMTSSIDITDQETTTEHLSTNLFGTFVNGYMTESPSNQTTAMTLEQNEYTETEYSIEFTDYATDSNYCLRTTNGGTEVDTYLRVAEASVRFAPVITNWRLNADEDISLVEGETTTVYATGTVSDLNGFGDMLYATSTIYRSGVGSDCTANDNNCYPITSLSCPFTNCSGNSCDVECSAEIQYFAEPTDAGTYAGEHWEASLFVIDTTNNYATDTSVAVDLNTLWALSLTSNDINYGTLGIGEDTGAVNATTSLQNTGNDNVDVEVEGTNMTASGSSIPVGNQMFATSSFTYSSCVICTALSGSASPYEVDLIKPTSASTPVTDTLYWGIYVPVGTAGTSHYGQNTFYAIGD